MDGEPINVTKIKISTAQGGRESVQKYAVVTHQMAIETTKNDECEALEFNIGQQKEMIIDRKDEYWLQLRANAEVTMKILMFLFVDDMAMLSQSLKGLNCTFRCSNKKLEIVANNLKPTKSRWAVFGPRFLSSAEYD